MTPLIEPKENVENITVSLPVKIEAHTSENNVWREMSRLESVSPSSADFLLTRALEVGQMILLKMPLKKEFRRFDHDKEQYRVWGVVRSSEETRCGDSTLFQTSVAFTGQEPPESFRRNPLTIYNLRNKQNEDDFWQVAETSRRGPDSRRYPRYQIPVEIYIAVTDADDNILAHEKTVTENISQSGASVFSELQLKIGDSVKFIKQTGGFTANAIVRHRRVGNDNLPRLHLEFVNTTFPLHGIE